jgi:hypothetical protein
MLDLFSPSKTAALRSIFGQPNSTGISSSQKKKRKSNTIAGPSSLDEENVPNASASHSFEPVKKSPKIKKSPKKSPKKMDITVDYTTPTINTVTENFKSSCLQNPSPHVSEVGTEVSSVSERRKWLKNFEKKQASNAFRGMDKDTEDKVRVEDDRNNHETRYIETEKEGRESPPTVSFDSAYSNGRTTSYQTKPVISSARKPRKPRPAINRRASTSQPSWCVGAKKEKEEVKATDDGYASVASLSKWLENDPTSAKKKRHVLRGRNIVSRSRQFEQNDKVVVEAQISRGAVGDKKKWLQKAFGTAEEDEEDACSTFSGYAKSDVSRAARPYATRYNKKGAQSEIITDDAASSLSVADKKDWLKKAFVKNSEERQKFGYSAAQTDVMHNRGRGEAASRAKLRFKERSARKLMGATSTRPSGKAAPSEGTNRVAPEEKVQEPIDEDTTPVDFRAARDFLVQRSNKNGHDTQVKSKVSIRKKRIERQEEESRRMSMSEGLVLKHSWDLSDTSDGRPSNVYEKKYVPANDIAPKRSFEELP